MPLERIESFDAEAEKAACLAHEAGMILLENMAWAQNNAPRYFTVCPNETFGSQWDVGGTGETPGEAWNNTFLLCFA
jgi:hypothetical protein